MSDHRHDDQHDHGSDGHAHGANQKRLAVALIISGTFMVAEIIGGLMSNSLALLSDAGHMTSDVAALALSLFALWFARRPATPQQTYGFYWVEILAAFTLNVTLYGQGMMMPQLSDLASHQMEELARATARSATCCLSGSSPCAPETRAGQHPRQQGRITRRGRTSAAVP